MNPEKHIEPLQLVTHPFDDNMPFHQAKLALEGGCRWIQLRMKNYCVKDIISEGKKIIELKKRYDFQFIINDYPEVAIELNADGVHLGKNDVDPRDARKILGDNLIVGGTANTVEDIEYLVGEGVDYIGLGPFRFTSTKENLSPVIGLDGYEKRVTCMKQKNISIPVVAIGSVKLNDVEQLIQTGLYGIAVSSSIIKAASIADTTKLFLKKIHKSKNHDHYKTIEVG